MNDSGAVFPDCTRGAAGVEVDVGVAAPDEADPHAATDATIKATADREICTRPTLIVGFDGRTGMRSRTRPGLTGPGLTGSGLAGAVLTVLALGATAACGGSSATEAAPTRSPSAAATTSPAVVTGSPSPKQQTTLHAAAPAARPHFTWSVKRVTRASLGESWHSGCPIPPRKLRAITMTIWGFDREAHRGVLISRKRAVPAYVSAFHEMYRDRFPIRRMRPVSVYGGSDNRSMRHDNTSAFNCRYAVSDGPKHWSMHAYGEAVDINPRENPYYLNGRVYPPEGEPYLDRSDVRRGMIVPGSSPVDAFTAVGWGWGGYWSSSPDYHHFSSTGG
jgi:hypothetical protein